MRVMKEHFNYIQWTQPTDLGVCPQCSDYQAKDRYYRKAVGIGNDNFRNLTEEKRREYVDFKGEYESHKAEHQTERNAFNRRIQLTLSNPNDYILMTFDYTKSVGIPRSARGSKVTLLNNSFIFH